MKPNNDTLIQKIELPNGLTLEIDDQSKPISVDAFRVVLAARITVPVSRDWFSTKELDTIRFEDLEKRLGTAAAFSFRDERNFIMAPDRESVFQELLGGFKNTLLGYLSKPEFPKRFLIRQYREKEKAARLKAVSAGSEG